MGEHTPTPWKVFTTPDGRKLVGIGGEDGEGILDCGFGVWAWDDAAGIANANLVVKAVNSHDALVKALEEIERLSKPGQTIGLTQAIDILTDIWNASREALAKVQS